MKPIVVIGNVPFDAHYDSETSAWISRFIGNITTREQVQIILLNLLGKLITISMD